MGESAVPSQFPLSRRQAFIFAIECRDQPTGIRGCADATSEALAASGAAVPEPAQLIVPPWHSHEAAVETAGVVNPPEPVKYSHWVSEKIYKTPDEWLNHAEQRPGSWWPEWRKWLAQHSGGQIPARKPGDGKLKPLEDAPGSYVKSVIS